MAKSASSPQIVASEVLEQLMSPHVDSFDYFADRGLPLAVSNISPVEVVHPTTKVHLRMWLEKPVLNRPMKEKKDMGLSLDQRLLPSECRLAGLTYRASLTTDLCLQLANGNVVRHTLHFGKMPIMVKSSLCHLRGLKPRQLIAAKEEATEMGGYFIVNGIERIIRLIIIPKRNLALGLQRNNFRNRGRHYTENAVVIRCVRQDQCSKTVRLYYLKPGNVNLGFSLRRREFLIPVGIILKAELALLASELSKLCKFLGDSEQLLHVYVEKLTNKALIDTSEREIFDLIRAVEPDHHNYVPGIVGNHSAGIRARIMLHEVHKLNLFTRIQCLQYIGKHFKHVLEVPASYSAAKVGEKILDDCILIHLDNFHDKFNFLIFMLQKLFAQADGLACHDNADALLHHEVLLPGHLLTMFVQERMQEWLLKVKSILLREMENNPAKFDLQNFTQVLKVTDRSAPQDISKKVEYLLSTGNLVTQNGLDLQQTTGFTLVADKLNFLRYISHFRSVHRGAFFTTLRTTTVRKLLPEAWGFLCPVHTPDGAPCGLLNHMAAACAISSDLDLRGNTKQPLKIRKAITNELTSLGMLPAVFSLVRVAPPEHLSVQLDGRIIGHMPTVDVPTAVARLRHLKVSRSFDIPVDLEVAYVPCSYGGAFPGLYLFSTPARFLRPVKQLVGEDKGAIELIGPYEQAYMEIKCPDGGDGGSISGTFNPTHEETHPTAILSVVASLTPWSDHNQSPRNMYQCQMGKQTMGTPAQAIAFRFDNKLYRLQTPQSPVARTDNWTKYHLDEFPTGTNAIVAVLAYTGYDMEDAMILNKSSMERGLCHGQVYKTETIDLTRLRRKGDGIVNVFGRSHASQAGAVANDNAKFIDVDGLPYVGQILEEGNPYCSVFNTVTGRFKLSKLKQPEGTIVDSVSAVGQGPKEPLQKVSIRTRESRNPEIGDKFSSRHGQKGVLSQLWPDEDMPFSHVTGMRPDLIINPHAFPSRMTIGMLLESLAAKVGTLQGQFVNATPFQKCNSEGHQKDSDEEEEGTIDNYGKQLKEYGFNYHGTEVMYSGILGIELTCEIYLGVVYYQRLRHMVADKYQVRALGPVNPMTRQPVKGRKMGGGIRFGEMERDALLAHGAAYSLHDRLHTSSDYHVADMCVKCGSVLSTTGVLQKNNSTSIGGLNPGLSSGAGKGNKIMCRVCDSTRDVERVAMPYVFRYLAAELGAMNIRMTLKVTED